MFTLPDLEYRYDAFGKYISKDIMELHHSKHHQVYVDKLNATIEGNAELQDKSIESMLSDLQSLPEDVREKYEISVADTTTTLCFGSIFRQKIILSQVVNYLRP